LIGRLNETCLVVYYTGSIWHFKLIEALMGPDVHVRKGNTGIWLLQGALALVVLLLILVWVLLVPSMLALPPGVAARVRIYPVLLLPLVAVIMLVDFLWLRPVYSRRQELAAGSLDADSTSELLRRVARFPYLSFFMPFVGIIAASVVVAIVQTAAHSTPPRIVAGLFLLACTHAVALSVISFGVARLFMSRFLKLPDFVPHMVQREPDLRKRLALGAACTVSVAWAIIAVMVFDHQCRLAGLLLSDPCLHPAIRGTVIFLGLGGIAVVFSGGALGYLLARDFGRDTEAVTDGIERLTRAGVDGAGESLPVLSADEVGEMTESFNGLEELLAEHDRQMRESAKAAQRAVGKQMEFFTVISHDLRTPLHSIIGFSQLLAEGDEGELSEDQLADTRTILKSGRYLLSLVNDVVDLSKIESGIMSLQRGRVDLAGVVGEVVEVGASLKRDGVSLASDLPADLPPVHADETRLKQILLNLVGNALKFTDRGSVRIQARPAGADNIEVLVEDSGPGIPEDKLGMVFNEFEQVRTADGKEKMGTGLGLAISRKLVQMHGGDIRAENLPAGGAVFSFDIPVFPQKAGTV